MSKEFKGTKGDWFGKTIESKTIKGARATKILSKTTTGTRVVGTICATHKDEGKSNLNLILAAPEMLKALQELTHLHQCEQEGLSSGQPTPEQWYKAVDTAEKSIQKALKS